MNGMYGIRPPFQGCGILFLTKPRALPWADMVQAVGLKAKGNQSMSDVVAQFLFQDYPLKTSKSLNLCLCFCQAAGWHGRREEKPEREGIFR